MMCLQRLCSAMSAHVRECSNGSSCQRFADTHMGHTCCLAQCAQPFASANRVTLLNALLKLSQFDSAAALHCTCALCMMYCPPHVHMHALLCRLLSLCALTPSAGSRACNHRSKTETSLCQRAMAAPLAYYQHAFRSVLCH